MVADDLHGRRGRVVAVDFLPGTLRRARVCLSECLRPDAEVRGRAAAACHCALYALSLPQDAAHDGRGTAALLACVVRRGA